MTGMCIIVHAQCSASMLRTHRQCHAVLSEVKKSWNSGT